MVRDLGARPEVRAAIHTKLKGFLSRSGEFWMKRSFPHVAIVSGGNGSLEWTWLQPAHLLPDESENGALIESENANANETETRAETKPFKCSRFSCLSAAGFPALAAAYRASQIER